MHNLKQEVLGLTTAGSLLDIGILLALKIGLTKRERISEPPLFRGFICYKESLPRYLQIHRIDFGLLEEDLWVSWDSFDLQSNLGSWVY